MTRVQAAYVRKEAAELGILVAEVKRRAMIYQCEMKEYYAKQDGLPFDTYHNLSFKEWLELDARKAKEREAKESE